jgi:Domain of unknown function (DUF4398)
MNSVLIAKSGMHPRSITASGNRQGLTSKLRGVMMGFGALCLMLPSLGCSSTVYITKVRRANETFEEAKAAGAERYSPYEFYAAEARLSQSKQLAAEAEYGSAITLARESNELSEQAIKNTNAQLEKKPAPKKESKP